MIDLPVYFEEAPWEQELRRLSNGSRFSSAKLLTLLAGEDEPTLEDAFSLLECKKIELDLQELPADFGAGEAALRLRREQELVKTGFNVNALEESDPLRLYLEELAAVPAAGDAQLLAQRMKDGEDVTEPLTNLMLSLVWQRACLRTGRGVLLLDLVQEGNLALLQALADYDGGDFEAYCDYRIGFAMDKLITLQARSAGVGEKLRRALEDYRSVDEQLLAELGRNPTIEELAEKLHMSADETRTVVEMFNAAQSMQKVNAPEEEPQEEEQAVEDTAYFRLRQRIAELLAELDETSAALLRLRFGLEGGKPMTPEQAGKKLGLTAEEVVALEAAALAKLRTV